jgi:hypothetical protein
MKTPVSEKQERPRASDPVWNERPDRYCVESCIRSLEYKKIRTSMATRIPIHKRLNGEENQTLLESQAVSGRLKLDRSRDGAMTLCRANHWSTFGWKIKLVGRLRKNSFRATVGAVCDRAFPRIKRNTRGHRQRLQGNHTEAFISQPVGQFHISQGELIINH